MHFSEETASNSNAKEIFSESSFHGLKEHVKKVMIPLLIKIFELKLAAQQAKTPPSRLQKKNPETPELIQEQLMKISEDLKSLQLWCQSCQNQIQKALKETEEGQDNAVRCASSTEILTHPAVEKSFSEAVTAQSIRFKSPEKINSEKETSPEVLKGIKNLFKKLFS